MASIINAVAGTGLTESADGSGIVKVQSNGITTNALAWVNFNGTTSPGTIRAQYNVSSVTKNSTGNFTLNFASTLSDANYVAVALGTDGTGGSAASDAKQFEYRAATTTSFNCVYARQYTPYTLTDPSVGCIAIFGN